MRISRSVSGKNIIEQATVVLAGGDDSVEVQIENLTYRFKMIPTAGEPLCHGSNPTPTTIEFTVTGTMGIPCQWNYPDVGLVNGQKLGVAFIVSTFIVNEDTPAGFWLSYTFTHGDTLASKIAGLLS